MNLNDEFNKWSNLYIKSNKTDSGHIDEVGWAAFEAGFKLGAKPIECAVCETEENLEVLCGKCKSLSEL